MHCTLLTSISVIVLLAQHSCGGYSRQATAPKQKTADTTPVAHKLEPVINEVSGIAGSKTQPGYLWAQEDSGNPPQLYLIGYDGKVVKTLPVTGAKNRDWEDMALSGGDLFIGDVGDNLRIFSEYAFYRFPEPDSSATAINDVQKIRFRYPDGAHDAEAFLIDPQTKDIFIITKRDRVSKIYRLAAPYADTGVHIVAPAGNLPYSGVVSAALSPDGKQIIVKTYGGLHLYTRKENQSIAAALTSGTPVPLPYKWEPQGEAITFKSDGSGYFTLSEQGIRKQVQLFFYAFSRAPAP